MLFDLDGTLIDSAPDLGAAADKMRVARGLPSLPLERYRPMAGAGARGMLGVAFGITPDHPDFAALREEFFSNYESCMTERTYAFDGVPELIAQLLARGLRLGRGDQQVDALHRPADAGHEPCSPPPRPWSAATARRMPSPIRRRCWRPRASWTCRPAAASTSATTSATWWPAGPPAWRTVAARYGYLGSNADALLWGAHAHIDDPLDLLPLLQSGAKA